MKKALALATLLLLVGTAAADIAPPPGIKRVALDNKITTEKEYADHAFFIVSGDKVTPAKLDPKTPLVISGGARGLRYQFSELVAVPKDAAKKYGTEKEFHAAIAGGKVAGLVKSQTGFLSLTEIKESDKRNTATEEWKLEKIDAKDGIVIKPVNPGGVGSAPPKEPKPCEEEEEKVAAGFAPKNGVWVAGFAAAASVVFAGLWAVNRSRRRFA